ncbi:phage Gp37/Gp68 family protein [Patescibacteria group bacterium]|nr:phage Gp37/Gp68 family protein [Patescibacteria group bacterium]
MAQSSIEWTNYSWNPLTGCSKISPGCKNCYAERMAKRLKAMGNPKYANGFKVTLHEDLLSEPLAWKKERLVFVNSMSDMFHEDVPLDFIQKSFSVMTEASQHIFQILTKRSKRVFHINKLLNWPENIWLGVSVENKDYVYRIEHLRKTHASVKFLSLEPLLGDIPDLDLSGIDWVIVGGESGPGSRPVKKEWIENIYYQCQEANVPFFFKQWGGTNKKRAGRLLNNRTWDEMPEQYYAMQPTDELQCQG